MDGRLTTTICTIPSITVTLVKNKTLFIRLINKEILTLLTDEGAWNAEKVISCKKAHIRSYGEEVKHFFLHQTLYIKYRSQSIQVYHKNKRCLKISCWTMVESCLLVYVLSDLLPYSLITIRIHLGLVSASETRRI